MLNYSEFDFPPAPDLRDPVTGDWLPLSESDKARFERHQIHQQYSASQLTSLLTSVLK